MQFKVLTDFRVIFIICIIFIVTLLISHFVDRFLQKITSKNEESSLFGATNVNFFRHIIRVIFFAIGISFALTQIPEFKVIGQSMLAGAGMVSLIAGLAAQQSISNVVSGMLIIVFKPFRIDDRITLNEFTGIVEDINLRQVTLRDDENNRVIIPNSIIGNGIVKNFNLHDTKCCKKIDISISYKADVYKTIDVIREEILHHPLFIDNRSPQEVEDKVPNVKIQVNSLDNLSVNLTAWAWAKNLNDGQTMYSDLLLSIKKRLEAEGIEICNPSKK